MVDHCYVDEDSSHLARILLLTYVIASQILCGGTIFGFTPLKQVFLDEGVYEELCDVSVEALPCSTQLSRLDSMFTLAASLFSAYLMPAGLCLRYFGPRFNYLLGFFLNSIGSVLLYLADSRTFDVYIPAYVLLATGNPLLYMAAFNFGKLYPASSNLLLSIFIGCFGFSSVIFYLFQEIHLTFHRTSSQMFFGYVFVPIALGVIGVFVLSPYPYVVQREKKLAGMKNGDDDNNNLELLDEKTPLLSRPTITTSAVATSEDSEDIEAHAPSSPRGSGPPPITQQPTRLKDRSIPEQLCSLPFLVQTVFFCWGMLHQNFYLGTMPDQVYMLDTKTGGAVATNIVRRFALWYPVGCLLAILPVGTIVRNSCVSTSIFTYCTANLIFSGLTLLPMVKAQWATATLYVVVRVGFFTVMSTYSATMFGFSNLSTMFGAAGCMAGFCSLLGYFLTDRALNVDDSFAHVNLLLLSGAVVNFAFPVLIRRYWEE